MSVTNAAFKERKAYSPKHEFKSEKKKKTCSNKLRPTQLPGNEVVTDYLDPGDWTPLSSASQEMVQREGEESQGCL